MQQDIRILIGNLSTDVVEEQIRDCFMGTAGQVNAVSIPRDPRTGKARGFAFVDMRNHLEAEQAVADLNGHCINGRAVNMSLTEPKQVQRKWYQFGPK